MLLMKFESVEDLETCKKILDDTDLKDKYTLIRSGIVGSLISDANENIELLVDRIVELEKQKNRGICVDAKMQSNGECSERDCSQCINDFYNEMTKELKERYRV